MNTIQTIHVLNFRYSEKSHININNSIHAFKLDGTHIIMKKLVEALNTSHFIIQQKYESLDCTN